MSDRVMRNHRGYRIGESHHRSSVPDAVVVQLRELHEGELGLGATKLHALFPEISRKTIEKIIYYHTRLITKPPPHGPSDEQRGYAG